MADDLSSIRHSGWESACGDRKETLKDPRMGKPLVKNIAKIAGSNGERRGGRTPFTAKSVLLAGAFFIGSLGYWIAGADKDAAATWLQTIAPGTMAVSGSYLGGFFVGWGARRTMKITSIVAGIVLAAVGLFVSWGWDGTAAQSWVNSATAWVGQSVEGAGRYLVSLLPSATAAGAGGILGFKRK
ncbi:MAG: hypothetical protein WBR24_23825 [Desulfobacterales bacterium]|jgi:uncharacterized membrane protein (Fun14 family)